MMTIVRIVHMKVVFIPSLSLIGIKLDLALLPACKLSYVRGPQSERLTWSWIALGFSKKASIALLASLSYA